MLIFSDRENTETLPQTIEICLHREPSSNTGKGLKFQKLRVAFHPLYTATYYDTVLWAPLTTSSVTIMNQHPTTKSGFLSNKIIDCNVKRFSYNEHPLTTSTFFCIFLSVVHGTQCSSTWPWWVVVEQEVLFLCQKHLKNKEEIEFYIYIYQTGFFVNFTKVFNYMMINILHEVCLKDCSQVTKFSPIF